MTDRRTPSDSPDPQDDLEQFLRAGLGRRAEHVTAATAASDDELATVMQLRREATARATAVRRRRVGTASVAGVAAAALVVGLVLNAQGPVPVNSTADAADGARIEGVATGSSTGSTTGSAKGWRTSYDEAPDGAGLLALRPTLAQTGDELLRSSGATTSVRGSGRDAAPLAVLADMAVGTGLRFLTASVQSTDQLGPGDGVETSIAGRPARVIVANNGWLRIVWSLDDEHMVLVQGYGVSADDADALLSTLEQDGSGTWRMDPGASGLQVVDTPAPTQQQALNLSWSTSEPTEPTTEVPGHSANLDLVSGGAYEFWASVASYVPWMGGDPTVVDVGIGDRTVPGILVDMATYSDGSNQASIDVLDPSGTVVRLNLYNSAAADADGIPLPDASRPESSVEQLRAAAPGLFAALDEADFAALLERAAQANERQRATDAALDKRAIESGELRPDGSAAGSPPVTMQPTTTTVAAG